MKIKHLPGALPSFLCTIIFFSCGNSNKEKIYPLPLEKEYYEQSLLRATGTTTKGGNRDCTVTVEEADTLSTDVDSSSSIGVGGLKITPKKKGEVKVKVKGNITNEIVELKIKVIDSHLAYAIKESSHPALSNGTVIHLISNKFKGCYFFQYNDSKDELSQNPVAKGTYDFSVKLENDFGNSSLTYAIPYLTLNYTSDGQGNFTDASTPPTPYKLRFGPFDGVTSVNAAINLIQRHLRADWGQLISKAFTRNSYLIIPALKTAINSTDYAVTDILDTYPEIPESVLEQPVKDTRRKIMQSIEHMRKQCIFTDKKYKITTYKLHILSLFLLVIGLTTLTLGCKKRGMSLKLDRPHNIRDVVSYRRSFPDLNDVHLKVARKIGISPLADREEAEVMKERLTHTADNGFYAVSLLIRSIPYLVPRASALLNTIGFSFLDPLATGGPSPNQVIITSVLRVENDMKHPRRRNGNASTSSAYCFGATLGVSWRRFEKVEDKDGRPMQDVSADTLKLVLFEALRDLRQAKKYYIKYELKQGCFHIAAR